MTVRSLLHDGRLAMEIDSGLLDAASRWLPLLPDDTEPSSPGGRIHVRAASPLAPAVPAAEPTLRLRGTRAWVQGDGAVMVGASGLRGAVDLAGGWAELVMPPDVNDAAEWDLFDAASIAAALLLGRMGRALAHAAAVVGPDGRAWLLVGDSHAGKSTTSANLLQAGWRYVSDDHVVLYRSPDGLWAEGWPRPFHLDEGWDAGVPLHRRARTDPRGRWPGRWMRCAPLAGLLFPRVEAPEATALSPLRGPDSLARLLRQSPWLLADRGCAAQVLALLREAAGLPAFALRLGLDTYADPALLVERLAPATGAG